MSICSHAECNLDTYEDLDECILHCSKEELDFFTIRSYFCDALNSYVEKNKIGNYDFCHFSGIAFPKADIQSTINYINILKTLKQIHFDNCHFFTSYIDLSDPEFFFQDCVFHDRWSIYND